MHNGDYAYKGIVNKALTFAFVSATVSAHSVCISGNTAAMNLEAENGYDSDCLSIDEYIENDDFFTKSEYPKKRVISTLPLSAGSVNNRKKTLPSTEKEKKNTHCYTEAEILGLEKKRKYFAEIIDMHVLIIEGHSDGS